MKRYKWLWNWYWGIVVNVILMDDYGKYPAKCQNAGSENASNEWDYKMLEHFK